MEFAKFKRIIRQLRNTDGTRISRSGMPNGFFFKNLLWFGDGLSTETAVSRGFIVEPDELDSMDEAHATALSERLRVLIRSLGEQWTLQVRYTVVSDYADVLDQYADDTVSISDPFKYRWQVWNRTERLERYVEAQKEGKLRRERLTVFFTHVIQSQPNFSIAESAMAEHFNKLAESEELAFERVQENDLKSLFPDCRVQMMNDRDHYWHYVNFLNPSSSTWNEESVQLAYDESWSIQENCFGGDIVQPNTPGISFQYDGMNHIMLVMRELPKQLAAGMVTQLTSMEFNNFEITVNIYPQSAAQVVKKFGENVADMQGEAATRSTEADALSEEVKMGQERIHALVRGHTHPVNVFLAVRLWHRSASEVISRATVAKNRFAAFSGATCHHATNAETARQLWFNTWPGWTYSTYRDYDLQTDDQNAADLLPWSASFTGRMDHPEALYDNVRGGLVGVSLSVNNVPQHMLVFGITGAGKSVLFADLFGQIWQNLDYVLIVEEGMSHGTSVQTMGATPIVINPNGTNVINYLDTGRLPLTREHLAGCVTLCMQMLGDIDNRTEAESVITSHLNLLFEVAYEDWAKRHHETRQLVEQNAFEINQQIENGQTYLEAWEEWGDRSAFRPHPDAQKVAEFVTDPDTHHLVKELAYAYMQSVDMPTHSELVELMTLTPIGGYDNNPLATRIGEQLKLWREDGPYGRLFDGHTNTELNGDVTHFELSQIPDAMETMKAAVYFLILNVSRQQVMSRPRAQRKFILFEEGARLIQLPGGAKALKEYYTLMRKHGAAVCTVFQQISALQCSDPTVRSAVLDNTKLFLVSAQPSPQAAEAIASCLDVSPQARETIKRYASPEHQTKTKFSSFLMVAQDQRRKLVGTLRNVASAEMVYVGSSDGKVFDERTKTLAGYEDVVEGILREARK